MSKRLVIAFTIVAMAAAASPSAAGDQEFMLGAGLGISYPSGLALPGAASLNQLLTVGVTGTYFTSSWVMVTADFSYGFLPGDLQFRFDSDGSYISADGWAWNFDVLVGVDKQLGDGGFLYAAAGLGIASSKTDMENFDANDGTTDKSEINAGTKAGLALGAGAGLPISQRMLGFINLRYRLIKSDAEITSQGDPDVATFAYGLGGPELMVGVAFWL
jgi:opacity protein-like surface antigen